MRFCQKSCVFFFIGCTPNVQNIRYRMKWLNFVINTYKLFIHENRKQLFHSQTGARVNTCGVILCVLCVHHWSTHTKIVAIKGLTSRQFL